MLSQLLKRLPWLLLGGMVIGTAQATVYPLPSADTEVIGEVTVVRAKKEETLLDIARAHSLGYDEIVHANPGVDRWAPGEGTPIVLPTRYILPDGPREGIILNIAELRVYYYPSPGAGGERVVHTYPVSIGRMDWKTPMGLTKVISKDVDPPWRPPASIKAEHAKEGDFLPDVVPGGPDNPLGRFAMRLGVPGYLIHGTNKPFGIGMRVTHGCVRMYPEDIEQLFGIVPVGTAVRLIDQPVKVGRIGGELLIEAHEPLEEDNIPIKVTLEQAQQAVSAKLGPDMPGVNPNALQAAIDNISGIPVSISGQPGSTRTEVMASSQAPTPPTPAAAPPIAAPQVVNRIPPPTSVNPPPTRDNAPIAKAPAPPVDAPAISRASRPYPSPDQYTPLRTPAGAATPNSPYPTGDRSVHPYARPAYGPSSEPTGAYQQPAPVYRPAPPPPSRYTPAYGNASTLYQEPPPYRRPAPATSAATPPPPVDTPAYRPGPMATTSDYYSRYPRPADYPPEPSYSAPAYQQRPVPQGSPIPYPQPVTPTTRP